MLDIYKLGEDVLYTPTEKVKKFDSALKMLIDAMFDTMDEADGVGLAGPQVGVSQKLFVVDDRKGNRIAFINPEIIETSVEVGPYEEGCLSVPGYNDKVQRYERCTVEYQDLEGNKQIFDNVDGLLAICLQHEIDHLHGKVFVDKLSRLKRERVHKKYAKYVKDLKAQKEGQ